MTSLDNHAYTGIFAFSRDRSCNSHMASLVVTTLITCLGMSWSAMDYARNGRYVDFMSDVTSGSAIANLAMPVDPEVMATLGSFDRSAAIPMKTMMIGAPDYLACTDASDGTFEAHKVWSGGSEVRASRIYTNRSKIVDQFCNILVGQVDEPIGFSHKT